MNGFDFADVDISMDKFDGGWTASLSGRTLVGDDLPDILNKLRALDWEIVQLNGEELEMTYQSWQTATATIAYHAVVKRPRNKRK